MPVERQQGLLINGSRECCATHRVVMTHTRIIEKQKNRMLREDTSTLHTASSTQLIAQQYTEYNTGRTHFTMMFFSNDWRHCQFLFVYFWFENSVLTENHLLYKYFIYGLKADKNVWECSRNCWNSTVNRWPRSTIWSMEQFAHSYLLTIPTDFRGTSRHWYNFSLWRNRFFPKSHNARISKLLATCRYTLRHPQQINLLHFLYVWRRLLINMGLQYDNI